MYRYYDIHTHNPKTAEDCLQIVNVHDHFRQQPSLKACSMGLHPWYLADVTRDVDDLKHAASLPNVLAIGECGLDKICDTDWKLQVETFQHQIELAEQLKKPLIIHCVRAYEEVIQLLARHHIRVPVIFHGFNKKGQSEKLTGRGYFLSFGASILADEAPAVAALKAVPADKFFLETDDSGLSIVDIYHRAAIIRQTSIEAIILQVQKNVQTVFNK